MKRLLSLIFILSVAACNNGKRKVTKGEELTDSNISPAEQGLELKECSDQLGSNLTLIDSKRAEVKEALKSMDKDAREILKVKNIEDDSSDISLYNHLLGNYAVDVEVSNRLLNDIETFCTKTNSLANLQKDLAEGCVYRDVKYTVQSVKALCDRNPLLEERSSIIETVNASEVAIPTYTEAVRKDGASNEIIEIADANRSEIEKLGETYNLKKNENIENCVQSISTLENEATKLAQTILNSTDSLSDISTLESEEAKIEEKRKSYYDFKNNWKAVFGEGVIETDNLQAILKDHNQKCTELNDKIETEGSCVIKKDDKTEFLLNQDSLEKICNIPGDKLTQKLNENYETVKAAIEDNPEILDELERTAKCEATVGPHLNVIGSLPQNDLDHKNGVVAKLNQELNEFIPVLQEYQSTTNNKSRYEKMKQELISSYNTLAADFRNYHKSCSESKNIKTCSFNGKVYDAQEVDKKCELIEQRRQELIQIKSEFETQLGKKVSEKATVAPQCGSKVSNLEALYSFDQSILDSKTGVLVSLAPLAKNVDDLNSKKVLSDKDLKQHTLTIAKLNKILAPNSARGKLFAAEKNCQALTKFVTCTHENKIFQKKDVDSRCVEIQNHAKSVKTIETQLNPTLISLNKKVAQLRYKNSLPVCDSTQLVALTEVEKDHLAYTHKTTGIMPTLAGYLKDLQGVKFEDDFKDLAKEINAYTESNVFKEDANGNVVDVVGISKTQQTCETTLKSFKTCRRSDTDKILKVEDKNVLCNTIKSTKTRAIKFYKDNVFKKAKELSEKLKANRRI